MPPPGRRRCPSRPTLLAFLCSLLFVCSVNAAGSVLGIDFGTLNLKAALVKPGIPLEIVLTKDSKRKEVSAVAFKTNRDVTPESGSFPERLYGGDALALQGRMPGEVFPSLKPLLGLVSRDASNVPMALKEYRQRYPAVQFERDDDSGAPLINSAAFADGEVPWSVEELLAMELASIKSNAESMAGKGNSVDDVVITIPAFYTADERRAIEIAADLAGLQVNALISDGLAVGMDYAKSRTFPEVTKGETPEYHIVFDMGAGSTTATVLRFQSRSVKDIGRFNKTVQEVAVVGTGWDRTLGGDSLTSLILDDYILKFSTKPVLKSRGLSADDIRSNGRVMSRLWKEADKARQVLSANTETSSSFEELLPDVDFRTKLSRADFEQLSAAYADRVSQPITDALASAKLEMKDIDSIILHGGAIRTPFVQKKLEAVAGGSAKLRSNVNADESAVFGAAFKGASLSPSFKVKEIRDSDVAGYAVGMTYPDGGKERKQVLFTPLSAVGSGASTKQVTFKEKDDFKFGFYQVVDDHESSIWAVETTNLTAGVKQLKTNFGCDKDEVTTKFSFKLSPTDGLPEIVSGSVSCEVIGDGKAESLGDSVKDWLGFGKKKEAESTTDEETTDPGPTEEVEATASATPTDSSDPSAASSATESSKTPTKPKKRTESVTIAFTATPQGSPVPAVEEFTRMRDRLAAFDQSDRSRRAREEALNVLESYTYAVRDFLGNADYIAVSTAAERNALSDLLATTREFLENSKDATRQVLIEKRKALKELVDPIRSRREQGSQRPDKIKVLKTSLDQTEKLIDMVKQQVEKAQEARRRAEEYDASQSAAASESPTSAAEDAETPAATPSTTGDELADLEEPDVEPTSTGEVPVPKYTNAADFAIYTDFDLTELTDMHASVSAWLAEQEEAQSKLEAHDNPVLLVKDIEERGKQLSAIVQRLVDKKTRHEANQSASSAKTAKAKATKASKAKKGKKTSAASTATEEVPSSPSDEPVPPPEEEILEMASEAREEQKSSSSSSSSTHVPDEL